jgi:hypothetical protein
MKKYIICLTGVAVLLAVSGCETQQYPYGGYGNDTYYGHGYYYGNGYHNNGRYYYNNHPYYHNVPPNAWGNARYWDQQNNWYRGHPNHW